MITIKVGNNEYNVYSGTNLEEACSECGGSAVFDMYKQGVRTKARNLIERRLKARVKPADIRTELETWNAGVKSEQSVKRVQNVKDSYKNMGVDELAEIAGDVAETLSSKKSDGK